MGVNCWWNFCSNFKLYWSHNLAEFNHVNSKLLSGLGKSFDGAWWIHKSGMCQTFSPVTWFLCVPSFYPESENVHIWMRLIQWKSPCLLWIMIMLMVSSRVAALIRPHWHDHAGTYIPANDVLVFVDNIREDDPRIHTKHSFKWWFISVLLPADMHPTWGRTWVDKLSWRVWIAFALAHLARCGGCEPRTNFKYS